MTVLPSSCGLFVSAADVQFLGEEGISALFAFLALLCFDFEHDAFCCEFRDPLCPSVKL